MAIQMKNIKENFAMNEKELLDFLNEIEDEDKDTDFIEEAVEETDNELEADKSVINDFKDSEENIAIESQYDDYAWNERQFKVTAMTEQEKTEDSKKRSEAQIKRTRNYKAEIRRINKEAFIQKDIELNDEIPEYLINNLISLLTEHTTQLIARCEDAINTRLERILKPMIPYPIRNCMYRFPDIIKMSKGFFYKTSEESGGLTYWATPKVPAYFKQNSERDIIFAKMPSLAECIDRIVVKFYGYLKKRDEQELRYGAIIVGKNIKTYYDLLKHRPLWFAILYKHITNKNL